MTKTNMDLSELLQKHDQGDLLRGIAEAVLQLIMEADVNGLIGAGRHERSGERTTWRNGYRDRSLDTRLGTLNLRVPKLRQGSYFPGFLEARKTSEQALVAVIQEAWISGVSTRRVDDLVQAMGLSDTLGLLLFAVIHSAGVQHRDGAPDVFRAIRHRFPWLRHVFADGGYAGGKLRAASGAMATGPSRSSSAPTPRRASKFSIVSPDVV